MFKSVLVLWQLVLWWRSGQKFYLWKHLAKLWETDLSKSAGFSLLLLSTLLGSCSLLVSLGSFVCGVRCIMGGLAWNFMFSGPLVLALSGYWAMWFFGVSAYVLKAWDKFWSRLLAWAMRGKNLLRSTHWLWRLCEHLENRVSVFFLGSCLFVFSLSGFKSLFKDRTHDSILFFLWLSLRCESYTKQALAMVKFFYAKRIWRWCYLTEVNRLSKDLFGGFLGMFLPSMHRWNSKWAYKDWLPFWWLLGWWWYVTSEPTKSLHQRMMLYVASAGVSAGYFSYFSKKYLFVRRVILGNAKLSTFWSHVLASLDWALMYQSPASHFDYGPGWKYWWYFMWHPSEAGWVNSFDYYQMKTWQREEWNYCEEHYVCDSFYLSSPFSNQKKSWWAGSALVSSPVELWRQLNSVPNKYFYSLLNSCVSISRVYRFRRSLMPLLSFLFQCSALVKLVFSRSFTFLKFKAYPLGLHLINLLGWKADAMHWGLGGNFIKNWLNFSGQGFKVWEGLLHIYRLLASVILYVFTCCGLVELGWAVFIWTWFFLSYLRWSMIRFFMLYNFFKWYYSATWLWLGTFGLLGLKLVLMFGYGFVGSFFYIVNGASALGRLPHYFSFVWYLLMVSPKKTFEKGKLSKFMGVWVETFSFHPLSGSFRWWDSSLWAVGTSQFYVVFLDLLVGFFTVELLMVQGFLLFCFWFIGCYMVVWRHDWMGFLIKYLGYLGILCVLPVVWFMVALGLRNQLVWLWVFCWNQRRRLIFMKKGGRMNI